MRPRFYAGKDIEPGSLRLTWPVASMRPRFYAGKDSRVASKSEKVSSASMRPRFYAGKDIWQPTDEDRDEFVLQ